MTTTTNLRDKGMYLYVGKVRPAMKGKTDDGRNFIDILRAYKLLTWTACPYPNFSSFGSFFCVWKAIKRHYSSIGLFQTVWISCVAFTSTPSTSSLFAISNVILSIRVSKLECHVQIRIISDVNIACSPKQMILFNHNTQPTVKNARE